MAFEVYIPKSGSGVTGVSYPAARFHTNKENNVCRLQFNWEGLAKAEITPENCRDGIVVMFDPVAGHIAFRQPKGGDHPKAVLNLVGLSHKGEIAMSGVPSISMGSFARQYGLDLEKVDGIYKVVKSYKSGLAGFQLPGYSWEKQQEEDPDSPKQLPPEPAKRPGGLIPGIDDDLIARRQRQLAN